MNKLQEEIMEIIQPYMDKTLSEGCYYYQERKYPDGLWKNTSKMGRNFDNIKHLKEYISSDTKFLSKVKILGHYDITAVLKYIDNKNRDDRGIPNNIEVELTPGDIHFNIEMDTYMIPNKPLNLYTEEEQTNLLELLKKLGNKN